LENFFTGAWPSG